MNYKNDADVKADMESGNSFSIATSFLSDPNQEHTNGKTVVMLLLFQTEGEMDKSNWVWWR